MATETAPMTPDDAALVFATPSAYADEERFHRACSLLRERSPIHRVARDGYPTFWAVTRHAHVFDIARNNEVWRNEPRPVLMATAAEEYQRANGGELKTLIHLDDPRHAELRGVSADWFKPRSLAHLDQRLTQLARASVDRMAELGGSCDFARDIAMPYPLQVILAILGLPESDYPRMLSLTQELFGTDDPEYARGTTPEELQKVILDFFAYFSELVADRQARPTGDLASVIANASVRDQPLDIVEQLSYYVIVASAGHDTTSSAMAGGVEALARYPEQLQRLRDDPELISTATDEIIRWVTPVKHFLRTAVAPVTVGGHRFEPGDTVLLSYPSANRDDAVFADPFAFDVGRSPNRHLAFGFGAHFCLGATLARMEIRALLAELVPRLDHLELAGPPERSHTVFVGGLKRLPLRYEVRAGA